MGRSKRDTMWLSVADADVGDLPGFDGADAGVAARTERPTLLASVRKLVAELFRYGVASAVALAVDVTILKTLVDVAHWHYLPASTLAFIVGAGVAYVLSIRFVFRGRGSSSRAMEFCYFLALGVVGLLVNVGVLSVGISIIGLGLLTSKAIAAVCAFTTNFALRRTLLFAP